VAIIGMNRALGRPVVIGGAIAIRRTMNLSSPLTPLCRRLRCGRDDQALKGAGHPATIFIDA
jgi:hypothetical protein